MNTKFANPLQTTVTFVGGSDVAISGNNISDTLGSIFTLNPAVKYYRIDRTTLAPAVTSYQISSVDVDTTAWAAGTVINYVQAGPLDPTVVAVYIYA